MSDLGKSSVVEALGTFALVFVGGGAIASAVSGYSNPGILGIALAHGLALSTLITALGPISGGHFNPAVTFAAYVSQRIDGKSAILYALSQFVGGALAGFLLLLIFGRASVEEATPNLNPGLGMVAPVPVVTGVVLEAALTFLLVLVVLGSTDPDHPSPLAGLVIGLTVAMDILVAGNLTGAAMNPARWLGTALPSLSFDHGYVYILGPLVGALLAGVLYGYYLGRKG